MDMWITFAGGVSACRSGSSGESCSRPGRPWELQQPHFPGAIPILDYYHAAEHLAAYCKLLPATLRDAHEQSLSAMMWEGEVLQMIHEMKRSLSKVTNTDQAWKQINYFTNNQDRMDYARYRDVGWPIGSGLVEGQCKLVVGRRFKGNGMRWRPHDNRCVLRTRHIPDCQVGYLASGKEIPVASGFRGCPSDQISRQSAGDRLARSASMGIGGRKPSLSTGQRLSQRP